MYVTVKGQATQKKPWRQGTCKTIKLRPQFSKWRSQKLGQKGREELEN